MTYCPPFSENHPRIREVDPRRADPIEPILLSTACWRNYRGTWKIENERLYLVALEGRFALIGDEPLWADWFSGVLALPDGDVRRPIHMGFATVFERELRIEIQRGVVVGSSVVEHSEDAEDDDDLLGLRHLPGRSSGDGTKGFSRKRAERWKTAASGGVAHLAQRRAPEREIRAWAAEHPLDLENMIARAATGEDPRERAWTLETLGKIPVDLLGPRVDEVLDSAARDVRSIVRIAALRAMAARKSPLAESYAIRAWEAGDEHDRIEALSALAEVRSPKVMDFVDRAITDGRTRLVATAVRIHGVIAPPKTSAERIAASLLGSAPAKCLACGALYGVDRQASCPGCGRNNCNNATRSRPKACLVCRIAYEAPATQCARCGCDLSTCVE